MSDNREDLKCPYCGGSMGKLKFADAGGRICNLCDRAISTEVENRLTILEDMVVILNKQLSDRANTTNPPF